MRVRTASRGSLRPASIMPSMAALTASDFIFMKSVRVLSRSKTMARIKRGLRSGNPRRPAIAWASRWSIASNGAVRSAPAGLRSFARPRRRVVRSSRRRLLRGDADAASLADLAVVDANVETAVGVVAHPRLVGDRGAIATVVGERKQHPVVALET